MFHQMSDGRSVYGFQYGDVDEANNMSEGFKKAIAGSANVNPPVPAPASQPPVCNQTPISNPVQVSSAPASRPAAPPPASPPTLAENSTSSDMDTAPLGSLASALQSVRLKKTPVENSVSPEPSKTTPRRPSIASLQAQIKLPTPAATPSPSVKPATAPSTSNLAPSPVAKPAASGSQGPPIIPSASQSSLTQGPNIAALKSQVAAGLSLGMKQQSEKSMENIASSTLDANLLALKNEIMKEMKKELELMKTEIINAMKF